MRKIYTIMFAFLSVTIVPEVVQAQEISQEQVMKEQAQNLFKAGKKMYAGGDYNSAIAEFDKAALMDKKNPEFDYYKALCYQKMKKNNEAIKFADASLSKDETYVLSHVLKGKIYQKSKSFDLAAHAYQLAAKHEREDVEKRLKYVNSSFKLYLKVQDYAGAYKAGQESADYAKEDLAALRAYAEACNGLGKYDQAIELMTSAITIAKADSKVASDVTKTAPLYYQLGFAHYQKGEYSISDKVLESAMADKRTRRMAVKLTPEYFYKLALAYHKVMHYDKSKEYINHAVKMRESFFKAHKLHGDILRKEEDHTAAILKYKHALEQEGVEKRKRVKLYNDIIELEYEDSKFDAAIETADKCIAEYPDIDETKFLKSMVLYRKGEITESIEIVEGLLKLKSTTGDLVYQYNFALGIMYKHKDESEKAMEAFKNSRKGSFSYAASLELEYLKEMKKIDE